MSQITFKDASFEKAVRKALNITGKKLLMDTDIKRINGILIAPKELDVFAIPWQSDSDAFNMQFPELRYGTEKSKNGEWVSDIAQFSHIKTLHIYSKVSSLDWLKSFNDLRELYIVDTDNKEWSFLEDMIQLEYLMIRKADFSDLRPIAVLCEKQQKQYEVAEVINDLEMETDPSKMIAFIISGPRRLSNLALMYCGITDISPLVAGQYISDLNLSHNNIEDLSALAEMTSIYYLTLRYNRIKNIQALSALESTYKINLRHNLIEDISVFKLFNKHYIGRLYLGDNPIVDFSPLETLHVVHSDVKEHVGRAWFVGGSKIDEDEMV